MLLTWTRPGLWILFSVAIASCSKFKLPDGLPPKQELKIDPPSAGDSTLKDMPFKWGAAVNVNLLRNNAAYASLAERELGSLTAENAMKWSALQPAQGNFTWADADHLVDFATLHAKRVHGHTLIWHRSLPNWVAGLAGDSATLEAVMKDHIKAVVTHFKGKVSSWDVVNEALEDDGSYRNSLWYQKLGAGYIARAFQYAHEADPDAILFYNDYGHEYSAAKRSAIINMVNAMIASGVPIHGIGMQMHTRYNQSAANLTAAITTAASTGLQVHISELDIAVNPDNHPTMVFTMVVQEQQAAQYRFIVRSYNTSVAADKRFGITNWNLTDGDSWIPGNYNRPDWPLLFDGNYQRKLAYYAVLEAAR